MYKPNEKLLSWLLEKKGVDNALPVILDLRGT